MTPFPVVLLENIDKATAGKHGIVTINPNSITQFRSIPLAVKREKKGDNSSAKDIHPCRPRRKPGTTEIY